MGKASQLLRRVLGRDVLEGATLHSPAVTLLEKESAQLSHNFAFTAEDADSPTYRLQTVSGMEISKSTGNGLSNQ